MIELPLRIAEAWNNTLLKYYNGKAFSRRTGANEILTITEI